MSSASTATKTSKRSNSPSSHRKPCDICHKLCDVLVRCRIDETLKWCLVCTSGCWQDVSGGQVDGPDKPFYQYGGMWKNKVAGASAKKPKAKKSVPVRKWNDAGSKYVTNDKVEQDGKTWICRKSHNSSVETTMPGLGYTYWKEYPDSTAESQDPINKGFEQGEDSQDGRRFNSV